MSKRLGETLVRAGKITEAHLHSALTAQLVFGGHLGTSLLELGFVDEDTLGQTLSDMFGVPYADYDTLSCVPYSVVRALPVKLVEKHRVVPLRIEGRALHLAMIDPKNLLALDEISFVTGYRLLPSVSPEVRILEVLERYYEIPRTQRYTTLARELSRLPSRKERLKPRGASRIQEAAAGAMTVRSVLPTGGGGPVNRSATRSAAHTGGAPAGDLTLDHWEKYGYGRSWREVAEAIDPETTREDLVSEEADTRSQPRTGSSRIPDSTIGSLEEASRRLAEADSVDEVIAVTLAYVAARLPRSIFFVVKGADAVGWAARATDVPEARIKGFREPLDPRQGSIFSLVPEGRLYYLGAAPNGEAARRFYGRLGVRRPPRTALVLPVTVKGRPAGYLYADGANQEILAIDLPALLSICARAGLALQILILRNKILSD